MLCLARLIGSNALDQELYRPSANREPELYKTHMPWCHRSYSYKLRYFLSRLSGE